ncbi:Uncharacterized protein YqfA, UPF0365 family [Atopostipes suicloacalis DSM 15692]|uniref:Flotillin-like protein FloA n=1 Tax=Atopostipes suicloacalis DSM 15692 TaxID=1121025 RepID=A0A1M4XIX6_9LACT|nr:flotillin-like protein FloA [Atopostipes suicloacalis]SHE93504.1 Uncharacterized protein YqfA, UPF0365 family [Atopostipes suicloacalis DSM 15692]
MDTFLTGNFINFIIIAILLLGIISLVLRFIPIGLWVTAYFSGVRVGLFTLVGMRLRRVSPHEIIRPQIKATKAGLDLSIDELEAHYLAGGNINDIIDALIASERANIALSFEKAAAIDLAGRSVFEAVQVSVNPKVIETPNIAAVAKNGIEIIAKAKVTVRANIDRLVGGAGEDTIIARVGEGIVTTVGSAHKHSKVLENPDMISQTVLNKGLDAGTAFEILSIDIADVDVGRNIGAKLQTDQAEADKNIAQAKAEEQRAMAIAREQEMRAKVTEAEAEVPLAIAEAFRSGNLGIMDYYNMKNVQADSDMRKSISREMNDDDSNNRNENKNRNNYKN